jgi:hypothetical protein
MAETAWGPSYDGDVIVDIGGNMGALIIVTPPTLAGREIEISPAGKGGPRSHVAVRERRGPDRSRFAAVFPALAEGDYTVWDPDGSAAASVTITGGTVAQLEWD